MPETSTNNLMYVTYLRSKGFKLIKCQIEWIPCVLFTLEGKGKRVKVMRKRFHQMGLEDFEQLSPYITEILGINEAHLKEAYRQQRRAHEERATHD